MVAYIFLLAWLLAGVAVLVHLPLSLRRMEVIAGGAVLGITFGSWLSFICSLVFGMQIGLAISGILALTFVSMGVWRWRVGNIALHIVSPNHSLKLWLAETLVLGVLVLLGAWLMYTHSFVPGSGGWYSGGYTWADLALHSTLASHFSQIQTLNLQFPIFPGQALSYPFLTDFFSGELLRLGGGFQMALGAPGIVLLTAGLLLSYNVVRRLCSSAVVGLLHLWLVLGTASVMGVSYFLQELRSSPGASLLSVITKYDYSQLPEQFGTAELRVVDFLTSHLLPQRSYLAGFAVMGLLFIILLELTPKRPLLTWTSGVLLGLLPLIHTHSFFVGFALVTGMWLHTAVLQKNLKNQWGYVACIALVLALPQLYWQLSTTYNAGFARPHAWWMAKEWPGWLFWLRNSGLLALCIIAAPVIAARAKLNDFLKVASLIALGLFVACNLYIFQPNDWDNMKFLSWVFWIGNIFFAWLLWQLIVRSKGVWRYLSLVGVTAAVIISTASGVLAIIREFNAQYVLASTDDIAFAQMVRDTTPTDAVILTSSNHNHPVSMLAGRTIVMGYPGWLWSYGIDYTPRERDIRAMFQGTTQAQALFKKYNVSYIAVARYEEKGMAFNESFYRVNGKLVAATADGQWRLFAINR